MAEDAVLFKLPAAQLDHSRGDNDPASFSRQGQEKLEGGGGPGGVGVVAVVDDQKSELRGCLLASMRWGRKVGEPLGDVFVREPRNGRQSQPR